MSIEEFIRLNVDATQEREPDLDQIIQRLIGRWETERASAYASGAADVLQGVAAALGRGESPSYLVAVVAEEFGLDRSRHE